jgi:hypothetical protein
MSSPIATCVAKPQLTAAERNAANTARVLRDNRSHHFCFALRTKSDSDKTRQITGRGNGGSNQ